MTANSKTSPDHTYILDDEDLDDLDGLSITAVLDEATDALGTPAGATARQPAGRTSSSAAEHDDTAVHLEDREPTIDELLEEPVFENEDTTRNIALEDTGTFEALDVLLPPEMLFGDIGDD